jgi:hypothetical protein
LTWLADALMVGDDVFLLDFSMFRRIRHRPSKFASE